MMGPRMKMKAWIVAGAFSAGAVPALVLNGILLLGFGPWSTPGAELLVFPGLFASLVVGLAILLVPFRRTRRNALFVGGAALALFIGTAVGIIGGGYLR